MSATPDDGIAATITLTERGWPRIGEALPNGLLPVTLSGTDNPYDIRINAMWGIEVFTVYWYVWTGAAVEQNDTLTTEVAGAFMMGPGDDLITNNTDGFGEFPAPIFLAGSGDDTIAVADDDGTLQTLAYGGSGDDSIGGSQQDDTLYGDTADGFVFDYSDPDLISPTPYELDLAPYDPAGDGDDTISGGDGNDSIDGGNGDNQLFGGDGSDTLTGGTGSDFLYGGPRGAGALDILTGGGGSDTYVLSYEHDSTQGAGGAGFWSSFFANQGSAVGGNVVSTVVSNAFTSGGTTILSGALAGTLGPLGGQLVADFLGFLFGLDSTPPPQPATTDVMMVTDFDPSMDVLVLPLIANDPDGKDLVIEAEFFAEFSDGTTNRWGLQFLEDGEVFAEVRLADSYMAALGFAPDDSSAPMQDILDWLKVTPALITPAGSFSTLASPEVLDFLPGGGFVAPPGANIPSGATVDLFGAIGGLLTATDSQYSTIAGTQYSDALTINAAIVDPATIRTGDLSGTASTVFGLGSGDILYGGGASDTLAGGAGEDTLYSFLSGDDATPNAESLVGGAGDDLLLGGASGGTIVGGGGNDTFGVVYGNLLKNALDEGPAGMQVAIDLTQNYAAERPASEVPSPAAPVGANPPFSNDVPNAYALQGIENAIGGPLNDWIKGATGSTIEGAAGADYLLAGAGDVTVSYAGSTAGVTALLDGSGASTLSGGDAAGDAIGGFGATTGVTGSDQDDTLSVGAGNGTVTGLAGADTFRVMNFVPGGGTGGTITDLDPTAGDRIDLRALGITNTAAIAITPTAFTVSGGGGDAITIAIGGANAADLTLADFILAQGASGRARADAAGQGLVGRNGSDTLLGRGGDDFLFGNGARDSLAGAGGDDRLDGGRNADRLAGVGGSDFLVGGRGDDTISGGGGHDAIFGGDGDDLASGGGGDDRITTGMGRDRADGGAGADVVRSAGGADSLSGDGGDDRIRGGGGRDSVEGGAGRDMLAGGAGADVLHGGAGNDQLRGGPGDDRLVGGPGRDTFVFDFAEPVGADTVRFDPDADRIVFVNSGFTEADLAAAYSVVGPNRGVLDFGAPGSITLTGPGLAAAFDPADIVLA